MKSSCQVYHQLDLSSYLLSISLRLNDSFNVFIYDVFDEYWNYDWMKLMIKRFQWMTITTVWKWCSTQVNGKIKKKIKKTSEKWIKYNENELFSK